MKQSLQTSVALACVLAAIASFAVALTGGSDKVSTKPTPTSFSDAFIPTGAYAISADFKTLAQFNDGAIELVSLPSREVTRRLPLPEGKCSTVVMSDDGQWLAALLPKRRVAIWNLTNNEEPQFMQAKERLYKIEFLPGKPHLSIHDQDRAVWDLSASPPKKLPLTRPPYQHVAYSQDGRYATGHDYRGTGVFDRGTGQQIANLGGKEAGRTHSLAFSPVDEIVAVGAHVPQLWYFQEDKSEFLDTRNGYYVTFAPDGSRLYVSGMGIHVYDVQSRKRTADGWPNARIHKFKISPDGRQFSFVDREYLYFRNIERVLTHRLTSEDVQPGSTWWPAACEPITAWPSFRTARAFPIRKPPADYDPRARYQSTQITPTEQETALAIEEAQRILRLINPNEQPELQLMSAWDGGRGRSINLGNKTVFCSMKLSDDGASLSSLQFATGFLQDEHRNFETLIRHLNKLLDTLCSGESPWKLSPLSSNPRGRQFEARPQWNGLATPAPIRLYAPPTLSSTGQARLQGDAVNLQLPKSIDELQKDWQSLNAYTMSANTVDILPRALKTLQARFSAKPEECTIALATYRLFQLSEFSGWDPATGRFGADIQLLKKLESRGGLAPILCIDFWGHFAPTRMCFHPETGQLLAIMDMYVRTGDVIPDEDYD